MTFLKNFYTVWDIHDKRVGFAPAKGGFESCADSSSKLRVAAMYGLAAVAGLALLFLALHALRRRRARRRRREPSEHFAVDPSALLQPVA